MSLNVDLVSAQRRLDTVRHCKLINMTVRELGDGTATLQIPYSDDIIGNPDSAIIAGGALTTLLDTACGYAVTTRTQSDQISPTLDLRIDYMGAAKPGLAVIAEAEIYRFSQNVVFTRGVAYQDDKSKPVAHAVATFMRMPPIAATPAEQALQPVTPEKAFCPQPSSLSAVADKIPYVRLIGVECLPIGEQYLFRLPARDSNLGNPVLPAIHGGVIGGFMESAAILHLMMTGSGSVPKIIDFSIDFLRPGRLRDSFCQCRIVRQGRKIVNVSIDCWQTVKEQPIATARAHFLLTDTANE